MGGPRLGALSDNRWSRGNANSLKEFMKKTTDPLSSMPLTEQEKVAKHLAQKPDQDQLQFENVPCTFASIQKIFDNKNFKWDLIPN